MKTILLLVVLVMLSGCQQSSTSKPVVAEPAFRKPTATEIFNLRSKCADFGQKIMNENIIGTALAQEQVSHYDPTSNCCYVELTVHTVDLTHFDDHLARYCYDGQTGEMVAWSKIHKGAKTGGGSLVGYSFGADPWLAATTKIDALMADDRKQ